MERFWRFIAVELGKRAGLVSVIGLLVTLILGFGITRLDFATGQDSYLNKSDQVYKDNVAYQNLFGGQAMLTLVTMDKGHTVNELFTPENQAKWRATEDEMRKGQGVLGVISPRTVLEFSDGLVQSPTGNPAESVAGQGAAQRHGAGPVTRGPSGAQRRRRDHPPTAATRCRRSNARSTTRRGSTSSCTTTRGRSGLRCGPSSSTTRTRRSSRASSATRRSPRKAPRRTTSSRPETS